MENFNLHGETIRKTHLLDKVLSDFDNFHKQLHTKQKNDDTKGKMQKVFEIEGVVSEDEAKKVFDVLLSTKQKPKSDEPNTSYE
jgi:hypothetical protein